MQREEQGRQASFMADTLTRVKNWLSLDYSRQCYSVNIVFKQALSD